MDDLHRTLTEMGKGKAYDEKQCKSERDSDWHLECCFLWIMYISQNANEQGEVTDAGIQVSFRYIVYLY